MTIDEFEAEGVVRMDDEEIAGFLSSQNVGVLGLPAEGAPSLRPLSFWFDGDETLYFLYVLGADSRKETLSARADAARFLVYRAEAMFNWRSVLLTGTVEEVPEEKQGTVHELADFGQRPDVIERLSESANTRLFRFDVSDRTGIKHLGLPPGLDVDRSEE